LGDSFSGYLQGRGHDEDASELGDFCGSKNNGDTKTAEFHQGSKNLLYAILYSVFITVFSE
jgi:hypothetical protein